MTMVQILSPKREVPKVRPSKKAKADGGEAKKPKAAKVKVEKAEKGEKAEKVATPVAAQKSNS
jgi:hypothetical protein